MRWKIIFLPICWWNELYHTFQFMIGRRLNQPIDGHTSILKTRKIVEGEVYEMNECEICGKKAFTIYSETVPTFYGEAYDPEDDKMYEED